MQLTVRTFLVVLSLWASQAGAATIRYLGTSTDASPVLQQLFSSDVVDIYAEFEFEASPGMLSNDPAVVLDARVIVGSIPTVGICYSMTSVRCTDIVMSDVVSPLWVQDVESLTFDDSGLPVAGILTLTGLTRSPWPTDIVFDFSTNQWTFDVSVFASASGGFSQVVPLPAAFYLFGSGLLSLGGIAAHRRLRPPPGAGH